MQNITYTTDLTLKMKILLKIIKFEDVEDTKINTAEQVQIIFKCFTCASNIRSLDGINLSDYF